MEINNPLIISDKRKQMPEDSWSQKEFYRELVIKKYNPSQKDNVTKLADVLPFLPGGIVYKDETGMGATTLELMSNRNSIIVEPIKITASSKASKHDALYVGSPTENYHPDKIEDKHIHDYLINPKIEFKKIIVVADSMSRVVKAILYANQQKLINNNIKVNSAVKLSEKFKETALKNLNNLKDDKDLRRLQNLSLLNEYFLLIDEIDSFQLDSSYRRSMEDCIDFYKLFKKEQRCMLSATDILFTDPDLQDEALTIIKYDTPNKREIDIITCGGKQLQAKAYDRIVETVQAYPDDKILVAYNTVNGCYNLAENLRINNCINNEDIAILCSVQSRERAGEYYKELNSDKLPQKLNFITSAYFTGFDLHERFHLISISGNRSNTQALSERRLKQIAGRCRNGLLSETIIHDIVIGGTFRNANNEYTSAALIFGDVIPKKDVNAKQKIITEGPTKEDINADNEFTSAALIFGKDINADNEFTSAALIFGDNVIPKKDVKNEKQKILIEDPTKEDLIKAAKEQVRSLDCMNKHYQKSKMLHEILEYVNDKFMKLLDEKQMRFVRRGQDKNLKISYLNIDATLESIRVRNELYLFDDALTLKLRKGGHNVKTIVRTKATKILESKISGHEKDKIVRKVIGQLKAIKGKEELDKILGDMEPSRLEKNIVRDFKRFYGYLDADCMLQKMEECLIGQRDNRKYNALLMSAQIQTLPDGHIIIDRLKYYFDIKTRHTPEEILRRITLFLLETGNTKKIKDKREAIKMLNNFRKTYRKADKEDGLIYYHIQSANPQKIKSIAKRLPLEQSNF